MIRIQNIYYMLAYAFKVLNADGYSKIGIEDFEHIEDLLAAIIAKGIANQIKRGIGREYITCKDTLSSPRGKIDVATSIKTQSQLRKQLACEYDDYQKNTYLNQVLKSTTIFLIQSKNVAKEQKKALKRVMLYFSDVDHINANSIKWSNIKYNRNNATYKMLINICYLATQALLPSTQKGKLGFSHFKDDQLHRLFENFVLEYYKKHYPEYKVSAAHIDWNVDDEIIDLLPRMKSDITIEYMGKKLIIDTKYYSKSMQSHYDSYKIHSGNLYQIYTYTKNADVDHTGDVSGVLLYVKTDEMITPDNEYMIDGNKISVKTLDLGREFAGIREQLDGLLMEWD